MIYFVYGNQSPLIKSRIKRIVKESLVTIDEMSYARFDAGDILIQDIVDEANYLPLGYDKKVIVCENAYFLIKPRPKNKIEPDQQYDELIKYLKSPNPSTDFIISVNSADLDEKSEIVSLLKAKAKVFVASTPDKDSWKDYIRKYFDVSLNTKIDNDAVNEIALRCEGDVALFHNNAKKLALYTDHVKFDDVVKLVPEPFEENMFQIYNFLLSSRNDEALRIYRKLLITNTEPVTMISTLANQFRLLNEVSFLSKRGMSDDEIGEELNIKPVRAKIIKKQTAYISERNIIKTLEELFNLDVQIKSGQVDRFYAFELFLINFKAE